MSFDTHAPDGAPSAAIATGARPTQADGPGRSTSPKTGDYVDWDTWLTRFPTPDPGRPVPTPDPKVTFGASPVKRGAAKAADGRHPWGRPLVPAHFRNRISVVLATLRVLFSRFALPGFNVSHIERRVGRECQNISMGCCPEKRAGGASRRRPRRGAQEDGREAPEPDSLAPKGAITLTHGRHSSPISLSVCRPRLPALFAQIRPSSRLSNSRWRSRPRTRSASTSAPSSKIWREADRAGCAPAAGGSL